MEHRFAAPETGSVAAYAGFLRGVNVGGKRKLPMDHLRAYLGDLGAANVRSYIQSGNVVFEVAPHDLDALHAAFVANAPDRFGFDLAWTVRSAVELERAVLVNPFLVDERAPGDGKTLHVGFLDRTPDPSAVAALPPSPSPPDAYQVLGREVYFSFPNGVGRSKLAASRMFDALGASMTVRNWRTVTTMLEMVTSRAS